MRHTFEQAGPALGMEVRQLIERSTHDVRVVQFVLGRLLGFLRADVLDGDFYGL